MTLGDGRLRIQVNQAESIEIDLSSPPAKTNIINRLSPQIHQIRLEVVDGPILIDGYIVNRQSNLFLLVGSVTIVLVILVGVWFILQRRQAQGDVPLKHRG